MIRTSDLYEYRGSIACEILDKTEYPWQALHMINKYITSCINKGIDGYKKLGENILVGNNVTIENYITIKGPCIIGDNTVIRSGAYIRENVIISNNCVVGNSTELKNCILMEGVQAPHYNYIGDSILGNGVHLGAGVICSNLKNNKKNVFIGEQRIDTCMRKVGAFIGDGSDVGCSCVLNPGTVIGKNTVVYPLLSLRGVYPESVVIKNVKNIVERRK